MPSINQIIGQFGLDSRTTLRDYQHAARTFLPGGQGNAPKVKFMFHTYFNINDDAWQPPTGENYGLLVKEIKLPSFKFDTAELNQYNRKRIIQTKIKYDPINVTFHDDNMSQMTAMWNAYYQYYYADSWNPNVIPFASAPAIKNYNRRNIYDPSISGDQEYGYRGGSTSNTNSGDPNFGTKIPFFKDITVYGLWADNFIAYTLINPMITSFNHDTYNYDAGNGTMTNQMTIDYETVVYNTGQIDPENPDEFVTGFGESSHYDKTESVNALGGPNSVQGILNRAMAILDNLEQGNILNAGIIFLQIKKELSLDRLEENIKREVYAGIKQAIQEKILGTGGGTANSPTNGSSPAMLNIANQGIVTGANNNRTTVGGSQTAGGQVSSVQDITGRLVTGALDAIFGG